MGRTVAVKGLSALFLIALLALAVSSAISTASEPPEHTVAAPTPPGTTTVTWTGEIPAGIHPTSGVSDCSNVPNAQRDNHDIHLQVPANLYDSARSSATFTITWNNPDNDEILTVEGPDGLVDTSDGGEPVETVTANDLPGGDYVVRACPFGQTGGGGVVPTTPQEYTGTLTFSTSPFAPPPPSADPQGLSFSATVPADPQRDEAEPDIRISDDGHVYTCGPTGFSGASDYAQVSTDGGDQFHLLGEEPRGQQGLGGGGDCGLATAPVRNSEGNFQYTYSGLGPLTGFTTSTSPDNGHTITNAGPQGNTNTAQGGGADRQWTAFLDDQTVLLSYNQQVPRNIVVQKSTDGGLTYLPGNDAIASFDPDFPGPMRSMPARFVDPSAGADEYVAYYGWNRSDGSFTYVNFAISEPDGLTWHNCLVKKIPVTESGSQLGFFIVADNDNQGNIYLTYGDRLNFQTYLTTLTADKLKDCTDDTISQPDSGPTWSPSTRVDRGNVQTTVFPWLTAGGAPGRVAVTFYGTETDGDPNDGAFKATWDVYVNMSLDALSVNPTFSQVKATTHPFHYDSICLQGLACDISQPPGDRSLADFFAIDYNPVDGRVYVVYDQGAKVPDEAAGHVATPAVIVQEGGPSLGGGTLQPRREVVRKDSDDPKGDALADYSSLAPNSANPTNVPAMDFKSQAIGREVNLKTGDKVPDGGFTVTMKLDDLSDAALESALDETGSRSLLWLFRFVNGYQASAAAARWSPSGGFSFGFNDYTTASTNCVSSGEKCQVFPGNQDLEGDVDQSTGTLRLNVPRDYLVGLNGSTGPDLRPTLDKAVPGTLFYDGTAFSLGSPLPNPAAQTFLYPIDNPPAMDFKLPGSENASCVSLIKGSKKKDKLKGTKESERIRGRKGNDRVNGRGGDDCVSGQGGKDRVKGGSGADVVKGGRGKDRLFGGSGNDEIRARRGAKDRVNCGKGKDVAIVNKKRDKVRKNCEKVRRR